MKYGAVICDRLGLTIGRKELTMHWKNLTNPDYIGAYALEEGEERTVTIKGVKREVIVGSQGKKEEAMVMYLEDEKPMVLNKTNAKMIEKVLGTGHIEKWAGRSVILYATPVSAFGDTVEALRVRPYPPKENKYICADCGKPVTDHGKYKAKVIANQALSKYGVYLCMECATARKGAE